MKKFRALCQSSLHLLVLIISLFLTARIAFSQDVIPDWTNVDHAPFNLTEPASITNPVITRNDVTDVSARFVADPFLFYENDQWYMFFEVFNINSGRGEIGLATSSDGLHWNYDQIVLSEEIHLSYPFVFKHNGEYYLIPETYMANEVRLYSATAFPYNWTYVSTLVAGRDFVDPSLFYYNNMWWMFVGGPGHSSCYLFYSDSLTTGWTEHPMSPVVNNDASKARPGGRSFVFDNDRVIRIAQKDDVVYGEQVRAFEVDILTKTDYAEHEIPESPILKPSGIGWNRTGMHHFAPWWNGNHWLCAVDGNSGGLWSIGLYIAPHPSFPNEPPTADAGPDQMVEEGLTVTLDGSNSTDPDDDIASYLWTQTAGPTVTLSDPTAVQPSFTSPDVEPNGTSLIFELTVTDTGGLKDTDTCIMNVTWVNMPPTADAGPDQEVEEGLTVTLDGSNSTDPDDDIASYLWTQIGGTPVTLSDTSAVQPTFVTSVVDPSGIILTFELTVEDNGGLKSSDEVSVTIYDNGITNFPADVLTMTCPEGEQVGIKVESGGHYTSLYAIDPFTIPDTTDKPKNLPLCFIDLQIKTDAVGGTVKVTYYLESQAGNDDKWFKYKDSTGVWEDCSAYASFNAARDQVTLTLVDGGDGDDGAADGWIVDPSGLSGSASTSTSSGSGGGGGGGCFIDTAAHGFRRVK